MVNKIVMKLTRNGNGIVVTVGDNAYMTGVNQIVKLLNGDLNRTHLSKIESVNDRS